MLEPYLATSTWLSVARVGEKQVGIIGFDLSGFKWISAKD